jgi:hypothetical protein
VDSVSFGSVTFNKIDNAYVEQLYPKVDFSKRKENSPCPPIPENRQIEIEAGILAKQKSLIGRTAARIAAQGDAWRARQEAYRECKITLGALSLYPIIFAFESNRPQLFRLSISGMSRQEFGPVVGYSSGTRARTVTQGGLLSVPPIEIKGQYIEKFKEYGWEEVSKFLRDRSDNDEIDRALETSLFWIAEAVNETLMASALTKYFTAIESLIIGPRRTNRITSRIASRLGVLVGQSAREAKEIKKEVERTGGLYGLRSQVAHAGKADIEAY